MKVDAFPQSADEYAAAGLVRYEPAWRIWRSEGEGGLPAAWYATRRARSAGAYATVVRDSARELAAALAEQARRAESREASARDPCGP